MFFLIAGAVIGLVLLTVAADQLVVGAGRLAARWGAEPIPTRFWRQDRPTSRIGRAGAATTD
jgi:hypothetical protein